MQFRKALENCINIEIISTEPAGAILNTGNLK